jgi:hypothetical protein
VDHAPSHPETTSLSRIRFALVERDREISAGRWLAFGTLLLFGSGFGAVAGIVAALLDQRLGLAATGHRLVIVTTFAALCAAVALLGRTSPSYGGSATPGSWVRYPAQAFVKALRLAARTRLRPSATTLREAAALLDAAGDPSALARRIADAGAPAMTALDLLGSLGLVRHRSLRRAFSSTAAPSRPTGIPSRTAPEVDPAGGAAVVPPRTLARQREVHGLRETWRWTCGAGSIELHAAALADWVLVQDEAQLTSLAADGSQRWSRPVGRSVTCVHVACDGARVAVLSERGVVTILDGANGERLTQFTASEAATSVAVAAGGARVWLGDRFGSLQILDGHGRRLQEIRVGHPIDFVAMASEVEVGVVASRRGHLSSVDPGRGETRRTFIRSDLHRVWVEEDGERALLAVPADGVLAWDFAVGSLDTYALDRAIRDAASDAPGDRLAALTYDDRLVVLDGSARVLWQCDVPAGSRRVRMSGDGDHLWCVDSAGTVRQLDVLDRSEARLPMLDLGASRSPTPDADPTEADLVNEPEPGGFRRLLIDPLGSATVLIHPDGRVAIQREPRNTWLVTAPGGSGTGDAVIADDGSAVGVVLDRGVRRIRLSDGATRDIALPTPRLARVPCTGDLLAATPHGQLWLLSGGGDEQIATGLGDLADLATSSVDEGNWCLWWSRRDGTVTRFDPRTRASTTVVPAAEAPPPVRLVATGDGVLMVDGAGGLRWLAADACETARASLAVPIVHVERAGNQAVALTDFLGNVHLALADGRMTGTLGRADGILRAGVDPHGDPWLLRVHRQVLLCQSWDGSIRARIRVAGTPLDLASGPAGAWALLTTAGLFSRGLVLAASSERARFLEL